MQDYFQVGMTKDQKALLLRGLRYVRSSVKLDMRIPTPESDAERVADLTQIEKLMEQIEAAPTMSAAEC